MTSVLYCAVLVGLLASTWSFGPVPVFQPVQPQPAFIAYPLHGNYAHPYNYNDNYDYRGCKSNVVNSTLSHHFLVGCVKRTDRLLFAQQFIKPSRWWQAREKIVEYPGPQQTGFVPSTSISGIRVFDNYYNGSGGYVSIISGGVGQPHVRLRLRSKSAGSGFNFMVKIFGQ